MIACPVFFPIYIYIFWSHFFPVFALVIFFGQTRLTCSCQLADEQPREERCVDRDFRFRLGIAVVAIIIPIQATLSNYLPGQTSSESLVVLGFAFSFSISLETPVDVATSSSPTMWLLLPILLYSVVFLAVRHIYSHWRRRGFPSEKAGISWSFLRQAYRREFRHVEAICEAYQTGRERLLGIYCFFRPVLLVRCVELAQTILQQSNGHFNELKWDYVKGYRRFNLLEKLAPMFAAKRLHEMFGQVQKVGDHLVHHLMDTEQAQGGVLETDLQQMLRVYDTISNSFSILIYF